MQLIFTPELLVKYLYNETTETETAIVKETFANDVNLQQEFKQLQASKYALDESDGGAPGTSVVQKILAFSKRNFSVEIH